MTVPATPDGSVTFDIDGLTQAESDAMRDTSGWRPSAPHSQAT